MRHPLRRTLHLLTLLLFSTALPAAGKCARSANLVWPPGGPLPPNGILVLEGYGEAQPIVEALSSGDAALECSGRRIDLEPTTISRGDRHMSQVQLRPQQPLPAGATCKLRVPELDGEASSPRPGTRRPDHTWLIADGEDLSPPTWNDPPELLEKRTTNWSNIPGMEIDFSFPVVDSGPALALAEVAPFGPGATKAYLIPIHDGKFSISYTICSGQFRLRPGSRYQIWLTAMDAAGNLSRSRFGPLSFTAPEREIPAKSP